MKIYPATEETDKVEILETVRASLPPAEEVFNVEMIKNPLIPKSLLREVLQFFGASPLAQDYLAKMEIPDISTITTNLQTLVWLSSLYNIPREKLNQVWNSYNQINSLQGDVLQHESRGNRQLNESNQLKRSGQTGQNLQQQIANLATAVSEISATLPNMQATPPAPSFTQSIAVEADQAQQQDQYASVVSIHRLP